MKKVKKELGKMILSSRTIFKNEAHNMINTAISITEMDHVCTVPIANGVNIKRNVRPFSIIESKYVVFLNKVKAPAELPLPFMFSLKFFVSIPFSFERVQSDPVIKQVFLLKFLRV